MRHIEPSNRKEKIVISMPWLPQWLTNSLLIGSSLFCSRVTYTIIATITQNLVGVIFSDLINPANIIGKIIGSLGALGILYYTLLVIAHRHKLKRKARLALTLSQAITLGFVVFISWFLSLTLSIIVFRELSLGESVIFSLLLPTLIIITATEPVIKEWDRVIRGFTVKDPEPLSPHIDTSRLIPWGKVFVKREEEPFNFFVIGNPGTGKSTWLEVMISFAFKYIGIAPDRRGIVFDSKPDQSSGYVPLLEAMGIKHKILNPNDKRHYRWAIAKDIHNEKQANEAAHIFIPEPKDKTNIYFTNAARGLIAGALFVLIRVKGDTYTLRDVVLACTNKDDLYILLEKHHPRPEILLEYLRAKKEKVEEITTILNDFRYLAIVAHLWEGAEHEFSIREWINDEGTVLIFGNDRGYQQLLLQTNHLIMRFLGAYLQNLTDVDLRENVEKHRRIWMVIDELFLMSPLPQLENILTISRSKGVCIALAAQNTEGLINKLGKEGFEIIWGLCKWKAILGVSEATAKFISELIGDHEWWKPSYSWGRTTSKDGVSVTESSSESPEYRKTVLPQELMEYNNLPCNPEHGLGGYFLVPYQGIHKHRYTWDEIQAWRVKRVDYVSAYQQRDDYVPPYDKNDLDIYMNTLKPWSNEERKALGLPRQEEM